MKKEKLKPWLLAILFLSVFCVFIGAWANENSKDYANLIVGIGLAGILSFIIIWTFLFGVTNRPSNWFRGKRF